MERSAPNTLRRISTQEALVDALRSEILSGAVAPGTTLKEGELCARFGVSRHTVRTSLQALTHEGLARHLPNRGVSIPVLDRADATDLFMLRTMLEVAAVRHLATTPEARKAVYVALAELEALAGSDDWEAVRDADLNFHHAMVDSLNSRRTTRTFDSLMSELRLVFLQLKHEFRDPAAIAADHAGIVAAIESGYGDDAEAAIRRHLENASGQVAHPPTP